MDITPINRELVQPAPYQFNHFSVTVDQVIKREDLVNPGLWVNVGTQMTMNDEVRVVSSDASFLARLFVTFADGHNVRVRVLEYNVFEAVEVAEEDQEHFIAMKGTHKWCIMKQGVPEPIKKGIPTKAEAVKELDEYKTALAS